MRARFCVIAAALLAQAFGDEVPASSPPKYPSPWMSSDGDWAGAYEKASKFVSQLTILEKVNLTTGVGYTSGRCLGNTGEIPRLNFPSLCVMLTPINNSFADFTSAFPAGINVAATWDRNYAYARGQGIGAELSRKGVDIVLTPQVAPQGRFPDAGRAWESFSPDPYLSGELVGPTVQGIQENKVISTIRHFVANEQERFRFLYEAHANNFTLEASLSANLDDRTLHEIYMWPFANAIRAGAGAIMCSYQQINNTYACENSYALNHLLKGELGFQGLVMSDFGAQHTGVNSAMAGLDMTMPGDTEPLSGASYWGTNLTLAVLNGTIPEWRLDDMCMRVMSAYFKVGRDTNRVPVNFDSFVLDAAAPVPLLSPDAPVTQVNLDVPARGDYASLIREIGAASTVLLKNKGILPLTGRERHVGVFGADAISNAAGANGCVNRACDDGTLAMGWGSGSSLFPYLISPEQAIVNRVIPHGTVSTISNSSADLEISQLAKQVSVCLVFVNANSGEGFTTVDGNYGDRKNMTLWSDGDALIDKVASSCKQTVVVMHTVGPVLISKWADHQNITAILWAGLPGQESGNAIVDVLYGDYNPSGKLPFTLGMNRSDYGPDLLYQPNNGEKAPQQNLSGLNIDYRNFDMLNITPIYEFGFGLSYTNYSYSNLCVASLSSKPYKPSSGMTKAAPTFGSPSDDLSLYQFPKDVPGYAPYIYPYLNSTDAKNASQSTDYGQPVELPAGYNDSSPQPILAAGGGPGGNPRLWDPVASVTATIRNTGSRAGHEVVQLYVSLGEDEPPKILRGFDRLYIESGEEATFRAQLLRRDVSVWSSTKQDWIQCNDVKVHVGSSSRNLPLAAEFAS